MNRALIDVAPWTAPRDTTLRITIVTGTGPSDEQEIAAEKQARDLIITCTVELRLS